ncbi:MAG: DUF7544 domain-containing protein [Halolamina sp.]
MTLYAVDDIDDALDATRALLTPFDLGRWARLAFVVFFLGGTGAFNPFQFGGNTSPGGTPGDTPSDPGQFPSPSEIVNAISPTEWAIIGAVVAVALLIGLAFAFVGAVMEFVFVESLRRERVSIREYWRGHWRRGARLLGFRLVLGLLSFGATVGLLLWAFWPVLFGDGGLSLVLLGVAFTVVAVLAVVSGLLNGFTTQFVVPVMIADDRTVLGGWRAFWPTLTGQWKQYLVYLVLRFVLAIAVAVVVGIATGIAALVLAIPFGILAIVGVALLTASPIVGWAVVTIALAAFLLTLFVLSLFVAVPVQTYLRYYALLVLGDTNESFDLVAERRRTIRS